MCMWWHKGLLLCQSYLSRSRDVVIECASRIGVWMLSNMMVLLWVNELSAPSPASVPMLLGLSSCVLSWDQDRFCVHAVGFHR